MKMRIYLALMAVIALTVPDSAAAVADGKIPHGETYRLRFVKTVGVAWRTEKFGWMSFVSFSANGRMVASDGPSTPDDVSDNLTIWSFPKGRFIKRLPDRPWSISSDWKYYAGHNSVRALVDGKAVLSLPDKVYALHAFSLDGAYVARAYSGQDSPNSRIQIFELATGKRIAAFGRHDPNSIAISPDGKTLASGYWNIITLWNMHTGKRVGVLRGLGRYVDGLSFRADGKVLVAGTDLGSLQIWDLRRHAMLFSLQLGGGDVSKPAFSPNGRLVAVGIYGTGTVWLIDAHNGKVLDHRKVSDLGCGSVAFSPDGRYLITPSTGGLIKWPYDRGGTIHVFKIVHHSVAEK